MAEIGYLFDFQYQIGKGAFSHVFRVKDRVNNYIFALKQIEYESFNKDKKERIINEINIIQKLKHPNIVKYYKRYIDKNIETIYIVFEYCSKGDLYQFIKNTQLQKFNFF